MAPPRPPLQLAFAPLTQAAAAEIVGWRYPPPYDLYNFDPATRDADLHYLTDPANRFYGIYGARGGLDSPAGALVGFCSLGADAQVPGFAYDGPALDVGLGLRPDLTGRGQGVAYVAAVVDFARRAAAGAEDGAPPPLRVTVATFNRRAQKVWAKVGFREVAAFRRPRDGMSFVVMMLQ